MIGTERQVLYRIYTVSDSVAETNQTILDIQNILDIRDENGEDMVLEWTDLWNTDDYSHH